MFARSYSPYGAQAFMVTPQMRDTLIGERNMPSGRKFELNLGSFEKQLNHDIEQRQFISVVPVPNLFEFDMNMVESEEDLKRLNPCRKPSQDNASADKPVIEPIDAKLTLEPQSRGGHKPKPDHGHGHGNFGDSSLWGVVLLIALIIIIIVVVCAMRYRRC
jgi:hypothetical protein